MDLLDQLVHNDPNNLNLLATIYESLNTGGLQSPHFQQMLDFLGGG
jgi:hypothetical protein